MVPESRTFNCNSKKMMMKRLIPFLYGAVLLCLVSCSKDDSNNTPEPDPSVLGGEKTETVIHYTAVVGDDTSRSTLDDSKQYIFTAGDKLYLEGENIHGVLTLKAGEEGKHSGASFEGDLTYAGSGTPDDDLALNAILVSTNDKLHTITDNRVTATEYPTTAITSTLADAVEQYGNFTGASTYGARSFTVHQQSTFLNFIITLLDNTTAGTTLTIDVHNNGSTLRTGTVTTATVSDNVVAQFVATLPPNTVMNDAYVKLGDKAANAFGGTMTMAGNMIYNIRRTVATAKPLDKVTAEDIGKVICSDGNIYPIVNACPYPYKASGMIAYVGTATQPTATNINASMSGYTKGLALALTHVKADKTEGDEMMGWSTASTAAAGYPRARPAKASAWFQPSIYQWMWMLKGCGSSSTPTVTLPTNQNPLTFNAGNIQTLMTACGGSEIKHPIWTATSDTSFTGSSWAFTFDDGGFFASMDQVYNFYVRPAFAF